ncbi:MAG: toll/interleukin-1 receptor domain-containing protein [Armatimonadota bacterium]|nr:toll/interleukin-1 receptor domain-containing protein [Armatimonadota bacterium]
MDFDWTLDEDEDPFADEPRFDLPAKLPKLLATLAVYADRKGETLLHDVLTASEAIVEESVEYYPGGPAGHGHCVRLLVPAAIYVRIPIEDLEEVEQELTSQLNTIARVRGERVETVALEIREAPTSGALAAPPAREADIDLWGDQESLRLFVSHVAAHKTEAHELKRWCEKVGISCFVAHEDIVPTAEWEPEILRALVSMDALLAWLTPGFHESEWTDQEVGVAIGRRIPVIPVRRGLDPYGFIGKYQALLGDSMSLEQVADEAMEALIERFETTTGRMARALVARFERADSFRHAEKLLRVIAGYQTLPAELISRMEAAPGSNVQVAEAWGVQEELPKLIERLRNV